MQLVERQIADYSPGRITRYTPMLDSWREYLTNGLTAEGLATLWSSIDQGEISDMVQLNEEMEAKDDHLQDVANQRRGSLTGLEWSIEPADDTPEAQEVADWVEGELRALKPFRRSLKYLARAIGPGISVVELVWRNGRLVDMIDVPGHRLTGHSWMDGLYIETGEDVVVGVEALPGKFVVHTPQSVAGYPLRVTITRAQAKLFLLKHYAIADWAGFMEKFGKPWPIAKVEKAGTPGEATKTKEYLRDMMSDGFGVFSPSVDIELKEASRGTEPFTAAIELLEKKQAKLYLGQTLSTDTQGTGSWALGRIHENTKATILLDDIANERETVENQLISHMVKLRFPGRQIGVPKFKRRIIETRNLEEERLTMDKVRLLRELGQPIDPTWLFESLGVPMPEGTPTQPIGLGQPEGDSQPQQQDAQGGSSSYSTTSPT